MSGMNTQKIFCRAGNFISPSRFIRRGGLCADAATERPEEAPHIRIRFDSREFFDLLARFPKALPYLAAGRHMRLALGGMVYEIYE